MQEPRPQDPEQLIEETTNGAEFPSNYESQVSLPENSLRRATETNTGNPQSTSQWLAFWTGKSQDFQTENLLETKQMRTVGSMKFDQTPDDQAVQADGFQIGDIICERYRLIHILGSGASAYVWLANDQTLERLVAVKLFRSDFLEDIDVAILAYEAKIMARFEHPSILPIYDIGRHGDRPFLILKFIPQQSSAEKIFPVRFAAKIIIQISESLLFLHEKGVFHCDIKPGNILISPSGQAYLSDYGISLDKFKMPNFEHHAGTPGFMAPERLEGKPVTSNADIYSLGVVFFYYLTGHLPEQTNRKYLLNHLKSEPKIIRRMIVKAVADDSKKRFANIHEVVHALRTFISRRRRSKIQIGLMTLAGILAVTAASYWMLQDYLFPGPNYPVQTVEIGKPGFNKVIHGDWDGDGDQDVGIFNRETAEVSTYFNDGKGGLSLFDSFFFSGHRTDINTGYMFNYQNLAIIQSVFNKPVIYTSQINNSKFKSEQKSVLLNLIVPVEPKSADFNKDGLPDLIVLDQESNDISLRFNGGNEQYREERIYYASEYEDAKSIGLYINDFNNDQMLDFAVGVQGKLENTSGMTVFLQLQKGTFDTGHFYPAPGHVEMGHGTVVDADQDSNRDILIPDRTGDRIIQFKNNGTGAFTQAITLYNIEKPTNVVNLDPSSSSNLLELAVRSSQSEIQLIAKNSVNKWNIIKKYNWPSTTRGLDATDLDNDGTLDVIVNTPDGNRLMVVHRKRLEE